MLGYIVWSHIFICILFNFRDFAYVARDRSSRRHMCHVFRCDTPARNIANKLRDICKQIMLERTLAQQQATQQAMQPKPEPKTNGACRPSDLPNLEKNIEQKIKMRKFSLFIINSCLLF